MRRSTALKAAAALLVLLSLAAAYLSIMSYWERKEEEEIHRAFMEWKAHCNKTDNSTGEEEHRYAVFKENFRRRGPVLNIFGDWTDEELRAWKPCALTLEEAELLDEQRQQVVLPLVEEGRDVRRWSGFLLLRQMKSGGSTIHGEMKHRWT